MDKKTLLQVALTAVIAFFILWALQKTRLGKYARAGIAGAGGHMLATAIVG